MSRHWLRTGLLAAAVLSAIAVPATTAASAAPACVPSGQPITMLQKLADGVPQAGKKVGAGWDAVILGTVTEVRHKSPAFRYRITLHVDSVLGPDLPALYTFFGSSKATYPFEVGKVYAVPVARRGAPGPLLPTTELWANACDPVVLVSDLPVAHEIIARTKPGYTPPPTPTPDPSPAEASPSATAPPLAEAPIAEVRASRVTFPDQAELGRQARRGVYAVGGLALLVALAAAVESWWSRRHFI